MSLNLFSLVCLIPLLLLCCLLNDDCGNRVYESKLGSSWDSVKVEEETDDKAEIQHVCFLQPLEGLFVKKKKKTPASVCLIKRDNISRDNICTFILLIIINRNDSHTICVSFKQIHSNILDMIYSFLFAEIFHWKSYFANFVTKTWRFGKKGEGARGQKKKGVW